MPVVVEAVGTQAMRTTGRLAGSVAAEKEPTTQLQIRLE